MSEHKAHLETLLLVVVSLILGITLFVYMRADGELNHYYDVPLTPLEVSPSPELAAEGERLARIRGCFWCHAENLQGGQYFAKASKGIIVIAPNLTRVVRESSPAEFARTVRNGVKPDGTSLQPAMPSFAFYNMSDADMAAIISYIQSLPEQEGVEGRFDLLPVGWFRWVAGEVPPNVAGLIDHAAQRIDPALTGPEIDRGRYLAESICTECHGDNGRIRVPITPDLAIAAAYSRDDFITLMRTGVALGERKIDYHMVDASKYRYTQFTDEEVDAMYAYFRSMLSPDETK